MFELKNVIRENILKLKPYASARDEFDGIADVMLDANENAYGSTTPEPFHRYPDPIQRSLKARISEIKKIATESIFIGNGSDETLDLLIRACCVPEKDAILIMPPTYGIYEVYANTHGALVKSVQLEEDYQPNVEATLAACTPDVKLLLICSPNNPTGNIFEQEKIEQLIRGFQGIAVLDEAYIDFCPEKSFLPRLAEFPNLVIVQTLSKAWGMAGLRLGLGFAAKEIIAILNKIKPPYNVNEASIQAALIGLAHPDAMQKKVTDLIQQRKRLEKELASLKIVVKVYPSETNFLLVRFTDSFSVFRYLLSKSIVVRDRTHTKGCENTLRITVGTEEENTKLLQALQAYTV